MGWSKLAGGALLAGMLTACGGGPPPLPVDTSRLLATAAPELAGSLAAPTLSTTAVAATSVVEGAVTTAAATSQAARPPATVAPVATTGPEATGDASSGAAPAAGGAALAARPLDSATCEDLRARVAKVMTPSVKVTRGEAAFDDRRGAKGTSCRLNATGSGMQFKDILAVAGDMRTIFEGQGWAEDQHYVVAEPAASATAYRKGGALSLVSVGWRAAGGTRCDKPVAACNVPRDQQTYSLTIDAVELSS